MVADPDTWGANPQQLGFGDAFAAPPPPRVSLADRFVVPPFSVLDARQGYWQERKRAWLALGIQSELGRGADLLNLEGAMQRKAEYTAGDALAYKPQGSLNAIMAQRRASGATLAGGLTHRVGLHPYDGNTGGAAAMTGTSIFDPVLCELVYRWFSPKGAAVLDPFAGGSVRGITAAVLGRRYTGIDLGERQIAANREQWAAIGPALGLGDAVEVKVSAAMARLPFNGCDPAYIRDVCGAACCRSSTAPGGTLITIHPSEEVAIAARGGVVIDGLLQPRPGARRCPFQGGDDLCGLHATPDKPFGCIASPFTLNDHDTLIVRNRYKLLRCYDDGPRLPAYRAFAASLVRLFGADEAARIAAHLDAGGGDLIARMPRATHAMLRDNDAIKHGRSPVSGDLTPRWVVGDSREVAALAPGSYDLLFSCPPYADLERYSDDPRDLSTLSYGAFLAAYRAIIAGAVALLAPDRFACFVVGDIRAPNGAYRNFTGDTIDAFRAAGCALYNEAILVTVAGSLPVRAGKQFTASRKLGRTHQNVLVFVKGDPRRAAAACGIAEVGAEDPAEGSGHGS